MARFCVAVIVFSLLIFSTVAESDLAVVCQEEDTQSKVTCKDKDNHGIMVDDAKYGKDQDIFCQPVRKTKNSSLTCSPMKDVSAIISPLCDGKEKCDSLIVNTASLGEVKGCENLKKYLLVYFKCVKIKERDNDQEERPKVEAPKKNRHEIQYEEEKTSTGIMFDARHNSSTATKAVELYVILLVLGTFCSLYS